MNNITFDINEWHSYLKNKRLKAKRDLKITEKSDYTIPIKCN